MDDNYRPRFSFEITEEQQHRLDTLIRTYGIRKALFSPILNDLLDLIEEYGNVITGLIISREAKPREIIPSLAQAERDAKKCQQ